MRFILLLLILTHCASFEKTAPEKKMETLSPAEKKVIEDYRAELEVGRSMAGKLITVYGSIGDIGLLNYLNELGLYVAQFSATPQKKFMFAILDDKSVNAYACPGGYIFITIGALRLARNEAELAAILGHEIAHVSKRHMMQTLLALSKEELDAKATRLKAERSTDVMKARQRPEADENDSATQFIKVIALASGGSNLNLLTAAKAGMNLMLEKGLNPQMELQADHEGVKYAASAGYDPFALKIFLARLQESKKNQKASSEVLDKTHPNFDKRTAEIDKALSEIDANGIIGATQQQRFQNKIKKLKQKIKV